MKHEQRKRGRDANAPAQLREDVHLGRRRVVFGLGAAAALLLCPATALAEPKANPGATNTRGKTQNTKPQKQDPVKLAQAETRKDGGTAPKKPLTHCSKKLEEHAKCIRKSTLDAAFEEAKPHFIMYGGKINWKNVRAKGISVKEIRLDEEEALRAMVKLRVRQILTAEYEILIDDVSCAWSCNGSITIYERNNDDYRKGRITSYGGRDTRKQNTILIVPRQDGDGEIFVGVLNFDTMVVSKASTGKYATSGPSFGTEFKGLPKVGIQLEIETDGLGNLDGFITVFAVDPEDPVRNPVAGSTNYTKGIRYGSVSPPVLAMK